MYLVPFVCPQIAVDEPLVRNNKKRMFADRLETIPCWRLKRVLGPDFTALLTRFEKKRPGRNMNLDCNITALRLFFTIIRQVITALYSLIYICL